MIRCIIITGNAKGSNHPYFWLVKIYLCIFPVIVCSRKINGNYLEAIETNEASCLLLRSDRTPGHASPTDEIIPAWFDVGQSEVSSQQSVIFLEVQGRDNVRARSVWNVTSSTRVTRPYPHHRPHTRRDLFAQHNVKSNQKAGDQSERKIWGKSHH